jgi:uncharacterized membrane protein
MDRHDVRATQSNWAIKAFFPAYAMLTLTLIGIAVALYVGKGSYTGEPLWCPIIDGCNVVVNSPYARVFGVPMAYFGFIYYLYMFALAARLAFDPFSSSLRFQAVLYAGVGAASSLYFMTFSSALLTRCAFTASSLPSPRSYFCSRRSGTFKSPAVPLGKVKRFAEYRISVCVNWRPCDRSVCPRSACRRVAASRWDRPESF